MIKRFKKITFYLFISFGIVIVGCRDKNPLPDPLEAGWKGTSVCEIVDNNSELRVLKCTFAPNVGHEMHYHNPHFGYTLEGGRFRITDTSGTREVEVPTGYSFRNDNMTSHEVLNIGETTAVFLIMEYK